MSLDEERNLLADQVAYVAVRIDGLAEKVRRREQRIREGRPDLTDLLPDILGAMYELLNDVTWTIPNLGLDSLFRRAADLHMAYRLPTWEPSE